MNRGIRGFALAAGAAALLSTQAVYAAPAPGHAGVDPLVSLSVLGTTQSRVALAAASGAVQGVPATQTCADGTVIPATAMCAAPAGPPPPPPAPVIGTLPLMLGLIALIGVMALVVSGGGSASGDLTPVSPA